MCGRYYVDDEKSLEIQRIIQQLDRKYKDIKMATKEIYPSYVAPILLRSKDEGNMEPVPFTFGYPNPYKKSLLINARTETALEKPTFKESVRLRRCIIPTNGYYEWDGAGYKYLIQEKESNLLYMAGLYQFYDGVGRFVILTTSANRSVRDVHHRMPLVLRANEMEEWLFEDKDAERILGTTPSMLRYSEVKVG